MLFEEKEIDQLSQLVKTRIFTELQQEQERFITYPNGMQKFLCDGQTDKKYYRRVYKMWNNPKFPRVIKDGIKGVYLSELRNYLKSK